MSRHVLSKVSCQEIILQQLMAGVPYIFPSEGVFLQRTLLYPLPPSDDSLQDPFEHASPEIKIHTDYCHYNSISSIAVSLFDSHGKYYPWAKSRQDPRCLPLDDSHLMEFLFSTCDLCRDYLVTSHNEEVLPNGIRVYARNFYEYIVPKVEFWQPGHLETLTHLSTWLPSYRQLIQYDWFHHAFNSKDKTITLCKRCQEELIHPVPRKNLSDYVERFHKIKRTLSEKFEPDNPYLFNTLTINPIMLVPENNLFFVSMCKQTMNQLLSDRLKEKQETFWVPRFIKKATPSTMLGTDLSEEDESMDPTDDSQTSQSEDKHNPWQEELDQLAEFERELDDY